MSFFVKKKTKCVKMGTGNIKMTDIHRMPESIDKAMHKDYNEKGKEEWIWEYFRRDKCPIRF